jgi:methylenetetrahydrofolate dehydrogenase (NADP+)/methenyltetrahydrofolate cyclohydrolase
LVGDDPASSIYVNKKKSACENVGIKSVSHQLSTDTSQSGLNDLINKLNQDKDVDGILVQSPLPEHLNEELIIELISPNKDVDGFHPFNIGSLAIRQPRLRSCTPYGVIKMLKASNINLEGLDATIVGVSNNVGRPMALELLLEKCTITSCHSRTKNLEEKVRQADLVVVAAGRQNLVKGEWIKKGAIVVDIGINRINNKLVGDVEFQVASQNASYITPVPGGVGPMTVATLMENTLQAQKLNGIGLQ